MGKLIFRLDEGIILKTEGGKDLEYYRCLCKAIGKRDIIGIDYEHKKGNVFMPKNRIIFIEYMKDERSKKKPRSRKKHDS